jgi:hypothetical protein
MYSRTKGLRAPVFRVTADVNCIALLRWAIKEALGSSILHEMPQNSKIHD